MVFDAKIVRIAGNRKNGTPFSVTYLVLVLKTLFKTVIFRKILDGDPTKITNMGGGGPQTKTNFNEFESGQPGKRSPLRDPRGERELGSARDEGGATRGKAGTAYAWHCCLPNP